MSELIFNNAIFSEVEGKINNAFKGNYDKEYEDGYAYANDRNRNDQPMKDGKGTIAISWSENAWNEVVNKNREAFAQMTKEEIDDAYQWFEGGFQYGMIAGSKLRTNSRKAPNGKKAIKSSKDDVDFYNELRKSMEFIQKSMKGTEVSKDIDKIAKDVFKIIDKKSNGNAREEFNEDTIYDFVESEGLGYSLDDFSCYGDSRFVEFDFDYNAWNQSDAEDLMDDFVKQIEAKFDCSVDITQDDFPFDGLDEDDLDDTMVVHYSGRVTNLNEG